MQSSFVSPADYQAFIAAHPQLDLQFPATAEQKARLAPAVMAWKRQQEQQGPTAAQLAVGALGAGALGLGIWAATRPPDGPPLPAGALVAGTTPATAIGNWAGDQSRRKGNRFRPDPQPRPIDNAQLGAIDKLGSDVQRGIFGSFKIKDNRNLYAHPVIGPLLDQQRWDDAKEAVSRELRGTKGGVDGALRAIDVLSGQKDEFLGVFSGKVESEGNAGGSSRLMIYEIGDGGKKEKVDPNDLPANSTILVKDPSGSGRDRAFTNGGDATGFRKYRPLSPADYTNKLRNTAIDSGRALSKDVDSRDIDKVGAYKAGLDVNRRDAPSEASSGEYARNPVATTGSYVGPIFATQGSDPMSESDGVLSLPSRQAQGQSEMQPYRVSVPLAEPNEITGQTQGLQDLVVQKIGDLPPEVKGTNMVQVTKVGSNGIPYTATVPSSEVTRRSLLMKVLVRGEDGRAADRYVPVSSMSDDAPIPFGTQFFRDSGIFKSREEGQGNLPPSRPEPAFTVDERGRLQEFTPFTPPIVATREGYTANTPAEVHNYNTGKVRYNIYKPERIEEVVAPGLTGDALRGYKKDFWPQGDSPEAEKTTNIKAMGAARIAAMAVRARELDNPDFVPGQRNLHALAHAGLRIVTPKGQEVPLDLLQRVVNSTNKLVEEGWHQSTGRDPLPLQSQRVVGGADLELDAPQMRLMGEGSDGKATLLQGPVQPQRFAQGTGWVALNDTPHGLHFELGTSPQLKAANIVRGLLSKPGPITREIANQVQEVKRHFDVSWNQIDEVLGNQANPSGPRLAPGSADHRAALKAIAAVGVGGQPASSFSQRPLSEMDKAEREGLDDDERKRADGDWKNFWADQLISGLAASPRLQEAALREATLSGNPADARAVASSWMRMVPEMVQQLGDEIGGLDYYDRVGIVGEAITRAAEDFRPAIDAAKASSDPVVRRLGDLATTAGVPGHFGFEQFAREYVGNAASLMGLAARTDPANLPALRIGEEAGTLLLAEARAQGTSIEEVINRKVGRPTSMSQAVLNLRAITKGSAGGLPNLLSFGGPKNEPAVIGAALARHFQENPTEGSGMHRMLQGTGKEIGFDVQGTPEFTLNNTGMGQNRLPLRLVFSSKAAEGRGVNENSLMEGTLEGLGKPVTIKAGDEAQQPGAISYGKTQLTPNVKGIDSQLDALRNRRRETLPGKERNELNEAIKGLKAAREVAEKESNAIAVSQGMLNLDANTAQGLKSEGTGGLIVDFNSQGRVEVQPAETYRGKAASFEQLQEQFGRAAPRALVGDDKLADYQRTNQTFAGAEFDPANPDVIKPVESDQLLQRANSLQDEIEELEASGTAPAELAIKKKQMGELAYYLQAAQREYGNTQGAVKVQGALSDDEGQLLGKASEFDKLPQNLPKGEGALVFKESFEGYGIPSLVDQVFSVGNQLGTDKLLYIPEEELAVSRAHQANELAYRSRQWQKRQPKVATAQAQAPPVQGPAYPFSPLTSGIDPDAALKRQASAAKPVSAPVFGKPAASVAPVPSEERTRRAMTEIDRAGLRREAKVSHRSDWVLKRLNPDPEARPAPDADGNLNYQAPSTAMLDRIADAQRRRAAATGPQERPAWAGQRAVVSSKPAARPVGIDEDRRRQMAAVQTESIERLAAGRRR